MSYRLLTLLSVLAAAVVTGVLCYSLGSQTDLQSAAREGDAMKWLRMEFKLSDDQYARVAKLHQDYGKICAQHCRDIQEAAETLDKIKAAKPADAAKLAAAERRVRELQEVCERSIEQHVRDVAACMPAKEGERYLAMVLPRIANFDHSGPPNLELRR